jgi:hypothetical protein
MAAQAGHVSYQRLRERIAQMDQTRGFRVGDRLFVTTKAGFAPATVVAPANRGGTIGLVRVRTAGGRELEAPVRVCFFDTPAFRSFVRSLSTRAAALETVVARCQRSKIVLGGRACAALPEYRAYREAAAAAAAAGAVLSRSHPYR